jgi:hypothetical protein
MKAFGQQCSPHCGCVLRFEASVDDKGKTKGRHILCQTGLLRLGSLANPVVAATDLHLFARAKVTVYRMRTCPTLNQLAKQSGGTFTAAAECKYSEPSGVHPGSFQFGLCTCCFDQVQFTRRKRTVWIWWKTLSLP